ncbi:MAG TPA: SEC-C metal-binding domain-containing protein [Thermoanaerobaculia bacterium]|nr:SEC-C metal-binding domain-containing protein [Thermoanaerobaculia bacterium]
MSLFSWLGNLFSSKPAKPRAELGRNDLCWCGSGKKYKKCHLDKDAKDRYEEAHAARVAAQLKGGAGSGRRRPTAAPERPAEKAERRGR